MSDFIARERSATVTAIEGLHNTRRACWRHACRHDGIEETEAFALFSEGNPFVPFLAVVNRQLREAVAALFHFGYGGLTIDGGKSKLIAPEKRRKP